MQLKITIVSHLMLSGYIVTMTLVTSNEVSCSDPRLAVTLFQQHEDTLSKYPNISNSV